MNRDARLAIRASYKLKMVVGQIGRERESANERERERVVKDRLSKGCVSGVAGCTRLDCIRRWPSSVRESGGTSSVVPASGAIARNRARAVSRRRGHLPVLWIINRGTTRPATRVARPVRVCWTRRWSRRWGCFT